MLSYLSTLNTNAPNVQRGEKEKIAHRKFRGILFLLLKVWCILQFANFQGRADIISSDPPTDIYSVAMLVQTDYTFEWK